MNKFFTQILFATLLTTAQLNGVFDNFCNTDSCADKILELYQKVPRCTPNRLWKTGLATAGMGCLVIGIPLLAHAEDHTGLGMLLGSALTSSCWLVCWATKRQLDEQSGVPESAALLQFQKDADV